MMRLDLCENPATEGGNFKGVDCAGKNAFTTIFSSASVVPLKGGLVLFVAAFPPLNRRATTRRPASAGLGRECVPSVVALAVSLRLLVRGDEGLRSFVENTQCRLR